MLAFYGLTLDPRIDHSTRVYTNIRWKTEEEKRKLANTGIRYQAGKGEAESSVGAFLLAECVHSRFKKDFILLFEFSQRYDAFSQQNGFVGHLK